MKLKTYGNWSQGTRSGKATVRINRNGEISLSTIAVKNLSLNVDADRLLIRRLEVKRDFADAFDLPEIQWFISVVPAHSEFYEDAIKISSSQHINGARFYCKSAASDLLDELQVYEKGVTLQIATIPSERISENEHEQETAYALITAPYLAKIKEKNIRRAPNVRIPIATRMATIVQDEA
jgi:hypothetical protein